MTYMVEQRRILMAGEVDILKLWGTSCLGTLWKETDSPRSCG